MNYQKIYNPLTNKYINIYSSNGKEILQKYLIGGSYRKGIRDENRRGTNR